MNDYPREQLCAIVQECGRDIWTDPRRCEALLRDYCGQHRKEINLLVNAIRERVPADLSGSKGGMPMQVLLAQLSKRLQEHVAVTQEAAQWAVGSWALALDLVSVADLPRVFPPLSPQKGPEHPRPGHLVVALDGTGTHTGLTAALRAAAPGSTIQVRRGLHHVGQGLQVTKPITLLGDGKDVTEVVGTENVLRYSGNGVFELRDLTVRRNGRPQAGTERDVWDVVIVQSGEVHLEHCRLTGAVERGQDRQAGLRVEGEVRGRVRGCVLQENRCGILLMGEAALELEDNTCTENEVSGIYYCERSGGTASRNTCSRSRRAPIGTGIAVHDQAHPDLVGNECANNGGGISYGESASGMARDNRCLNNFANGIQVAEQSQPTLEGNTCQNNGLHGLAFYQSSGGKAWKNSCRDNGINGISVSHQARPHLTDNICTGNGEYGIKVEEQSRSVLERCQVMHNHASGIVVREKGNATIWNCTIAGNQRFGIEVVDTASATVENSDLRGNQQGSWLIEPGGCVTAARNQEDRRGAVSVTFHTAVNETTSTPLDGPISALPASAARLYALVQFSQLHGTHTCRFDWYAPTGRLYNSTDLRIEQANGACPSHAWLAIRGHPPATQPGSWRLQVSLDGTPVNDVTMQITAGPGPPIDRAPGGLRRRIAAYVIDALILVIPLQILSTALGPSLEAVDSLLNVVIYWTYFARLESSSRQATVGKMALGLRVETARGGTLTPRRAAVRTLVSTLVFVGILLAVFTERRQALHDKLTGSVVVRRL